MRSATRRAWTSGSENALSCRGRRASSCPSSTASRKLLCAAVAASAGYLFFDEGYIPTLSIPAQRLYSTLQRRGHSLRKGENLVFAISAHRSCLYFPQQGREGGRYSSQKRLPQQFRANQGGQHSELAARNNQLREGDLLKRACLSGYKGDDAAPE